MSGIDIASGVTTGAAHSCATRSDGSERCWGQNSSGQLGNGSTGSSNVPVAVTGVTGGTSVAAGDHFTCTLLEGGGARCWGYNAFGQLGNGTTASSNVPVEVLNYP